MRQQFSHIPNNEPGPFAIFSAILSDILLLPLALIYAYLRKLPGIRFQVLSIWIGIKLLVSKGRGARIPTNIVYSMLFRPIDTVRYFEFGATWNSISDRRLTGDYLDVSSPRLLPISILVENDSLSATILNPDIQDLQITQLLIDAMNLKNTIEFRKESIEDLESRKNRFDLITSISVIEHIPQERLALNKIWSLLRPGGLLILSVPCSKAAFYEVVDIDEYGLGEQGDDGFFFGQRFYDNLSLEERIFSTLGPPDRVHIYGEICKGWWFKNRQQRLRLGRAYPYWFEPVRMVRSWRQYSSIDNLPGVGIVVMKFRKPEIIE